MKNGCQPEWRAVWPSLHVPGPGDAVTGAHPARSHHSKCGMAPKTMEYELTGGRRGDDTLSQQATRRVEPSEDASLP